VVSPEKVFETGPDAAFFALLQVLHMARRFGCSGFEYFLHRAKKAAKHYVFDSY
jgi:hypothetical protein